MADQPDRGQADGGWLPPQTSEQRPPSLWSEPQQAQWGQPPTAQWGQPPQTQWGQPPPAQWASDYQWVPREPENSPGLAGFIVATTSLGLLITSFGFFGPLTLFGAIAAMIASHRGLKKVDRGETTKRKDLARWGFWLGFVALILSLLATVGIALLIALE